MRALVLAGGSGTRFWPLSRRHRPKQLLGLGEEASLLERTIARLAPLVGSDDIWICATEELAGAVRERLPWLPEQRLLLEPEGRNTGPAIAWSLEVMPEESRDEVVVVLPSDHRVADQESFRSTLERADRVARAGERILTLGVTPLRPETGYGYLELAEVLDESSGLRRVRRFVEKPGLEAARKFVAGGNHLWNAGIFVFRVDLFLRTLARVAPEIARITDQIRRRPDRQRELYASLPRISVDHAVMEKLDDLATLPLSCGWSDLGSWQTLWEILPRDRDGNAARGDVVLLEGEDNLIYAEEGTVATLGVSGLVVVRTGDVVLVIPKERSQEVRRIVADLEERGRRDLL